MFLPAKEPIGIKQMNNTICQYYSTGQLLHKIAFSIWVQTFGTTYILRPKIYNITVLLKNPKIYTNIYI